MSYYVLYHSAHPDRGQEYFNLYCLGNPRVLLCYSFPNSYFGGIHNPQEVKEYCNEDILKHIEVCENKSILPAELFFSEKEDIEKALEETNRKGGSGAV